MSKERNYPVCPRCDVALKRNQCPRCNYIFDEAQLIEKIKTWRHITGVDRELEDLRNKSFPVEQTMLIDYSIVKDGGYPIKGDSASHLIYDDESDWPSCEPDHGDLAGFKKCTHLKHIDPVYTYKQDDLTRRSAHCRACKENWTEVYWHAKRADGKEHGWSRYAPPGIIEDGQIMCRHEKVYTTNVQHKDNIPWKYGKECAECGKKWEEYAREATRNN